MVLYCHHITPRLEYTLDFLGGETGIAFQLTTDTEWFKDQPGPKLNYSRNRLSEDELFIEAAPLLFENDIKEQVITCIQYNGRPAFFKSEQSDLGFDFLAAAFYLLSRYEEYLPHSTNRYGCYAHENSLAFKEHFLNLPLVNLWIEDFKKSILSKWPSLSLKKQHFRFKPTYDIDVAWNYQHKGVTRNLWSMLKHSLRLNFEGIRGQVAVLKEKQADPFDAYSWLEHLHKSNKLHPAYFVLLAKKLSKYDRNISPHQPAFQQLIRDLVSQGDIGIHPSWQTMADSSVLREELEVLEKICEKPVINSRQHYIRWQLPFTFRNIVQAGIQNEFSMGYSTINGFRASVASMFRWYDLAANKPTPLQLWPFCFMDSTAIFEQHSTEEQAFNEIKKLAEEVRKVNGLMITIWHNNYLGSDPQYSGWKNVYERFVREIDHFRF